MTAKRWAALACCNALGAAMFLSWLFLPAHGFWQPLDDGVFFAFQKLIAQSTAFTYFVAFTNLRPFDAVAFLCMLAIYLYHFRKADARGRRWMVAMGLSMMVAVVLAKQCDMLMHFERLSPTKYFIEQGVPALKVSTLTGWPSKDASGMSFPGDHGMMLIIFAAFMLRYYGKKTAAAAVAVAVIFSLPRMMSGAHWMTDVVVGAGSIACVVLSWMLLTPVSDNIIAWFEKKIPWKKFGRTFADDNP